MSTRSSLPMIRAMLAMVILVVFGAAARPAAAVPWGGNRHQFASLRFEQVWRDADLAVQQGRTTRSWTWGPRPWFDYNEVYRQSPNSLRRVQYFDKARMEINDPNNTGGPLGGVTNGLLTVELVSGRVKLGNGIGADENQQREPSGIPVAGNPPASGDYNLRTPVYASFRNVATTDNAYRDPNRVGQRVGTTFTPEGPGPFRQDLANLPGTDIVAYEPITGHNVPSIFRDFMNAGPVFAITAFGYPITDPYWIVARVGSRDVDVMVQLFERRSVTYTPSNPKEFQVEMGNVGQHYFGWRYPQLGAPWASEDPQWPIIFGSRQPGPGFMTYQMNPSDRSQRALFGLVPYSILRAWTPIGDPINHLIYGEVPGPGDSRQVMGFQFFTRNPLLPVSRNGNNYHPVHSPDGQHLLFVSDRDGNPELYMIVPTVYGTSPYENTASTPENPSRLYQLTFTAGCINQHPSWLPDGSGIVYESSCQGGKSQLYRGTLSYKLEGNAWVTVATPISPVAGQAQRLTNNGANDHWPRVSPDGSKVAFFSDRDGNNEIYAMNLDGSGQSRLTNHPARDEAPTWSPDSTRLVFNSNRDGDHELFMIGIDGSGLTQLTNNTVDDGYAVWGW